MTKRDRRKQAGAKRKRVRRRKDNLAVGSVAEATAKLEGVADTKIEEELLEEEPDALAFAIRAAGIGPLALLVSTLALHELIPWPIPSWFRPIVDNQTAVLTLCAGQATIIGLLISTKGRFVWSTYALLIAAAATALAGHRTIGESTSGHLVAVTLPLLTVPAVWAEWLSTKIRWVWTSVRSRKGLSVILIFFAVVVTAYNQSRNENYIRDWFLIPLGILAGIGVATCVLWLVAKLVTRCFQTVYSWLSSKIVRNLNTDRTESRKASNRTGRRARRGRKR